MMICIKDLNILLQLRDFDTSLFEKCLCFVEMYHKIVVNVG